jgi:hypothetical protein
MNKQNYWVKIRYETEIRVHCPNENVAKDHAMELFLAALPNVNANDLRIIHVETSEDRK